MKSKLLALSWDFFKQSLWVELMQVAIFTAVMLFWHKVIALAGGGYVDATRADPSLYMLFLAAPVVFWLASAKHMCNQKTGAGIPSRLYTLPLATWILSGWSMLMCMILTALAVLAMIGLFYLGSGVSLLMWGPVAFAMVIAAWGQAVLWTAAGSVILRLVSFLVVFGPLVFWLRSRFYGGLGIATSFGNLQPWTYPTAVEWLTMLVAVAVAYLVGWYGVACDRRGDVPSRPIEFDWWDRRGGRLDSLCSSFTSPERAQIWYIRREERVLARGLLAFVGGMILLILLLCGGRGPAEALNGLSFISIFILTYGAFCVGGLMAYRVAFLVKTKGMPVFLATRPATDRFLALTTLRAASLTYLIMWAVFAIPFLALVSLLWGQGNLDIGSFFWSRILSGPESPAIVTVLLALVLSLVIGWTLMGIGVATALTGRQWPYAIVIWSVFAVWLGRPVLEVFGFEFLLDASYDLAPWALYLGCLGGTIALAGAAFRKRFIGGALALCASLWLLCLIGILPWCLKQGLDLDEAIGISGTFALLALPVAPMVAAPLALAWNRHR